MINLDHLTEEEIAKIETIVKRFFRPRTQDFRMKDLTLERVTLFQDIVAAHTITPLDLDKFLHFDDFSFYHDIYGIRQHLDRNTGKLKGHFIPRSIGMVRPETEKRTPPPLTS